MTENEQAELDILRYCTEDTGKMAIPVIQNCLGRRLQPALERLQHRRWLVLADVSAVGSMPNMGLMRVFLASEEAMAWRAKQLANIDAEAEGLSSR